MKGHFRVIVSNQTGKDLKVLMSLTKEFLPFAQKQLGFWKPVKVIFKDDPDNAANPLGKTGYYDPQAMEIGIYASDRHPKDILRSLAHELTHHAQNCQGQFSDDLIKAGETGADGTYAQTNTHLRSMEAWAYEKGNLCLRDWENTRTEFLQEHNYFTRRNTMSTTKQWKDKELFTLLSESWGYNTSAVTEGGEAYKKEDKAKGKPDKDGDNIPDWADKNPDEAGGDEDRLEEAGCASHKKEDKCPKCEEEPCKCEATNEGQKPDHPFFDSPEEGGYDPKKLDAERGGPPTEEEEKKKKESQNESVDKTTVSINEEFIRKAIRKGIRAHFNK